MFYKFFQKLIFSKRCKHWTIDLIF